MAKQLGLHKVHGKVGEFSYYQSKNGGSLMRSINTDMSERVKSSKEYANTRLNNAEFGGAGSCAGAIVRGITSRWRFILSSKATGLLAKAIKAGMMFDSQSAWGERTLRMEEAPAIQERFNKLSKNQVPDFVKNFVDTNILYDGQENKVFSTDVCSTTAEYEQEMIAKGAKGVYSKVYIYSVSSPEPLQGENKYAPASSVLFELSDFSVENVFTGQGRGTLIQEEVAEVETIPMNSDTDIAGILVIMLPYKTVGSQNYILQELCSAYWKSVEAGTAPEP